MNRRKTSVGSRRLVNAFFLTAVVLVYGTLGNYFFLGGKATLEDCAYRTMMMLATVNEAYTADQVVGALQPWFKLFMTTLIVFGIAVILYGLSTITAFFVEGELEEMVRHTRMKKQIKKFKNHFIICGAGSTGINIAREISTSKQKCVIIEKDPEILERLNLEGMTYVEGDALDEDVLQEAMIDRAQGIAVVLREDKDNLFLTLTARQMNRSIRIITRGSNPSTDKKLKIAGADTVVSPAMIGGLRMASQLIRPSVVSFLDSMMRSPNQPIRMEEITINPGCLLENQTIKSSNFRQSTGLQIVAIKTADQEHFSYLPSVDTVLANETIRVGIGPVADVAKARSLAGMPTQEGPDSTSSRD